MRHRTWTGPDLTTRPAAKNLTQVLEQVRSGGNGMPAFEDTLTDEQIRDVAAYVVERINGSQLALGRSQNS